METLVSLVQTPGERHKKSWDESPGNSSSFCHPGDDIMRKHLLSAHKTRCMPRKQLPFHCCLRFGFMDSLTQSTMPTASVDNNSLSERQREGHPQLNKVQCQPFFCFVFFFYSFLLGSGVAGPPLLGWGGVGGLQ